MPGLSAEERGLALSIVVCARNEARRLEDCLRSLFAQSLPPDRFEVVLVDDESTDATPRIARRMLSAPGPRPAYRTVRIRHAGLSAARNIGIQRSRAPVIAFIDGDATASFDWARRVTAAFDLNPALGVVGGRVRPLNAAHPVARLLHVAHFDASDETDIVGCNMAFRGAVLHAVGGFDPRFRRRGDETSLLLRVRAHGGFEIAKLARAIVHHERPERLRDWFWERVANGRYYAWCERLAQPTGSVSRACVKRVVTLSPFVLLPLALIGGWCALAAIPGLIGIARRTFGARFARMRRERSPAITSLGVVANVCGDACSDAGYLLGAAEGPRRAARGPASMAGDVTSDEAVDCVLEREPVPA